jgi:hypothetical protein
LRNKHDDDEKSSNGISDLLARDDGPSALRFLVLIGRKNHAQFDIPAFVLKEDAGRISVPIQVQMYKT